ncbi:DapH/DapD/GlmU-related protein [Thalassotalea sp. 1_MG-2023]|uniref:serine O-acetyltransferase n=1 Tax=Thalassotalea sp. 1_MG-2023 TaxID=3062680 RepID=UPI0026E14592|nr:DapH/DapD/GlmU-related protein [Thalassotalea sp. 1_MG-2023]MDO6425531.1 DapH/DapD/GlmU-related protein [Thalassotalea sp. 1_MG-2023]
MKYTAKIGKNVGFFHNGLGVVIHKNAEIGEGTCLYQNVTIGGNGKESSENGVPTIGKHVFIGAGAVILGPVRVGNYAKIGANSVVLDDIPAHATAVGSPARVISRAYE